MLERRGACAKQRIDKLVSHFSGLVKEKRKNTAFCNFSSRKTLIYEHIHDADFLMRKGNSINSLFNYIYVNERIREINSILANTKNGRGTQQNYPNTDIIDDEKIDKVIENLYRLCVKGNIDTSDERIRYYIDFVLSYVNEYMGNNVPSAINKGIEKDRIGKKFISVKSYLRFLDILKVLNIKNEFNSLLKYVSENIHFFPIDIVKKIAFNHDLNRNYSFFFKNVVDYMYTLIQSNIELYYKELQNMNDCINIYTHFFFAKKYNHEKKTYDYEINEDVTYFHSLNYIYINHILTFGNLIRSKEKNTYEEKKYTNKIEMTEKKQNDQKDFSQGNMCKESTIYSDNISPINNDPREGVHNRQNKERYNNVSLGWIDHLTASFNNLEKKTQENNFTLQGRNDEKRKKRLIKETNQKNIITFTPYIAKECVLCVENFHFNYHMVDTIYVLFNYYTHLLYKKKKQTKKEFLFFFIPDIRENITDILLNFINILSNEIRKNKIVKNKKIIDSLERILKLGDAFEIPFTLEPFIIYHCNVLLVSKFDLSLLDNIKILSLFRELNRVQGTKLKKQKSLVGEKAYISHEWNSCGVEKKTFIDERSAKKNDKNYDQLAKMDNNCLQKGEKKKKKNPSTDQFHTKLSNTDGGTPVCNTNNDHFMGNMIKLVFDNLKKCLHNAKGNDVCMLMPAVYEFHKHMDEEIKNILTVQVTCNKDDINEQNLVNILRVFCKIGYRNELIDKFLYNSVKFLTDEKINKMKDFSTNEEHDRSNCIRKDLIIDDVLKNTPFSCPKLFLLFFYYKGKSCLFTYKDIYYVENYVQNSFFEMNIKDFIYLLLIYHRNKIVLLPQLLLKIFSIFNNGKKYISVDDLLFGLFLLSKNYLCLANSSNGKKGNAYYQNNFSVIEKINLFRKSKYCQPHIDNIISVVNDMLLYLYDDKLINCKADEMKKLQQEGNIKSSDLLGKETDRHIDNHCERSEMCENMVNKGMDPLLVANESWNNRKANFNDLKYNMIMMKIFYNLYYNLLNVQKKKKKIKILNSHHEKFLTYLFSCFNDNFLKHEKDINYISPLLYYFSYFNIYSPFHFEKQISYILKNCAFDYKLFRNILLSHIFIKKKIPTEIKNCMKEYVSNNYERFPQNIQVETFKFCNHFLVINGENENVDQDQALFKKMLNIILSNLQKMKPKHYLDIYITISNNCVKIKQHYINLFNHMNRHASQYTGEQLMLILFYMYKTGYSKPKIRKKIRNLILHYHKKRQINLSTYIKYVLPLDEFGIYHLFPVKFQQIIYDKLTEDVRDCVREPLNDKAECEIETKEMKDREKKNAPIYIFEQMVKSS
ncbi:hypothetical protein, conserved [Plasmodium gonderi]|uniref:Uncharacterized protein n=1 Tax=Plasmodium gonderi TaxID=77519 RepID=A0A1Y1JBT3_PLAGO|nr:hypothetical protein, conserved [Plasmodium gonderi]GAW79991.1 hypothetical protein, conserved [Plasmodium gonderi]